MSFGDIYGHEKIIDILRKTLAQQRIAHAYLFSGVAAIGKRTLALELIKAVNCEQSGSLHDSCGECSSCRKIDHASHPDIFSVEPEGQYIRIASVRQMQERTTCRPLEARRRAFIIDDADRMNEESANALLKMLEEPSPANMLFLITTRPYAMLQPLFPLSARVAYRSPETVARFLESEMGLDHQRAMLLGALSGGSVGSALELNKEDIALTGRNY